MVGIDIQLGLYFKEHKRRQNRKNFQIVMTPEINTMMNIRVAIKQILDTIYIWSTSLLICYRSRRMVSTVITSEQETTECVA